MGRLCGRQGRDQLHTSLGEESAEALIGILSLALLSEVTIGLEVGSRQSVFGDMVFVNKGGVRVYLDTVLKAVEL